MLRCPQGHVDGCNNSAVVDILRQHIERHIGRVEHRLTVQILCRRGLDHDTLFAQPELIYIAVVCNVHALQHVNGVCVHSNAGRQEIVEIVGNVEPVNNKLPLVAASMHNRRNVLKSFYVG